MKTIGRLLRKLTFVDEEFIINHCSASTQKIYAYLGLTILITGTGAMVSSFIAFLYIFPNALVTPLLLSIFWGGIVMVIQRGVVASRNRITMIINLLFAVVLMLAIIVPIELKIYEKVINKEAKTNINSSIESNKLDLLGRVVILDELKNEKDDKGKYKSRANSIRHTSFILKALIFFILILPDVIKFTGLLNTDYEKYRAYEENKSKEIKSIIDQKFQEKLEDLESQFNNQKNSHRT